MLFLVVDDDALSREVLTLLLEVEGHRVQVAASGEDAIARLEDCARLGLAMPEVILADIQMPGIAGDALAGALRPRMQPGAGLFAMSGSQPAPDAIREFDGFLLKPFKISELQSMISEREALAGGRRDCVTETLVAEKTGPSVTVARSSGKRAHDGRGMASTLNEAMPSGGVLDEEIYSKLRDLMPAEQLHQMYTMCIEDSRKRIARMKTLSEAGDDAKFRSEAHAVKGGCGLIGAKELYGLAEAAERDGLAVSPTSKAAAKAGKTGSGTSGVTATLNGLSIACDRLEHILIAHKNERTQD